MNKKFTEKTAAAACNRLLKSIRKNQPKREKFHTAWIDAAGRQCVCDGYRAYRLNARLDAVETTPGQIPMDLDKIFAPLDAGKVEEIPAPDADAVRLETIHGKNAGKYGTFDFGPGLPAFNAEYLQEILRLFPGAKWYFEADEKRRMCSPAFIVHEAGTACVCPVRKKPDAAADPQPVEKPAPAPVSEEKEKSKTPGNSFGPYAFFIYARFPGDTRFYLADLSGGAYKVTKFHAPRYKEQDAPALMEALDRTAALNPGASFQLRKLDGKTVVYNAVPTFSPEEFAESCAA